MRGPDLRGGLKTQSSKVGAMGLASLSPPPGVTVLRCPGLLWFLSQAQGGARCSGEPHWACLRPLAPPAPGKVGSECALNS